MEVMEKKIKKEINNLYCIINIILIIFIEFKIIKFIILELINNFFKYVTSNSYLILLIIIISFLLGKIIIFD